MSGKNDRAGDAMYVTRLLLILTMMATGCAGPVALRRSRQKYNQAVQRTSAEQLLLNLVRLRYRDPPSFMEMSSLSTQFSFAGGFSASGRVPGDSANLSGDLDASERPTITYDVLQGQEFVKRLVSPMREETIILLIRSGWSIRRILPIAVQDLNGMENTRRASGPTPQRISQHEFFQFARAVELLREFQVARKLSIGYESVNTVLSSEIPKGKVDADAMVSAVKEGWKIQLHTERVRIKTDNIRLDSGAAASYLDDGLLLNIVNKVVERGQTEPIRVRFSADAGADEPKFVTTQGNYNALNFMACKKAALKSIDCIVEYTDKFVLTGGKQQLVLTWRAGQLLPNEKDRLKKIFRLEDVSKESRLLLSIEPRSLLGTMYYLSHGIQVPPAHEAQGLVTTTLNEVGEVVDWNRLNGNLLGIQSARKRPACAAIAVRYRGYWFYIDDRDLEAKATFTLLMQLFELQAGGGATGTKPVLTLPVGA